MFLTLGKPKNIIQELTSKGTMFSFADSNLQNETGKFILNHPLLFFIFQPGWFWTVLLKRDQVEKVQVGFQED